MRDEFWIGTNNSAHLLHLFVLIVFFIFFTFFILWRLYSVQTRRQPFTHPVPSSPTVCFRSASIDRFLALASVGDRSSRGVCLHRRQSPSGRLVLPCGDEWERHRLAADVMWSKSQIRLRSVFVFVRQLRLQPMAQCLSVEIQAGECWRGTCHVWLFASHADRLSMTFHIIYSMTHASNVRSTQCSACSMFVAKQWLNVRQYLRIQLNIHTMSSRVNVVYRSRNYNYQTFFSGIACAYSLDRTWNTNKCKWKKRMNASLDSHLTKSSYWASIRRRPATILRYLQLSVNALFLATTP